MAQHLRDGRTRASHFAAAALLARHGYRRACIVGHSYGTFVASRICQLHPKVSGAGRRGAVALQYALLRN